MPLQHRFFSEVGKMLEPFDASTDHAQTTPSNHALSYSWGELRAEYMYMYYHTYKMYLVITVSRTSHTVCDTDQVAHVTLATTLGLQANRNGGREREREREREEGREVKYSRKGERERGLG